MQIEELKSLIETAVRDGLSYQWVMLVLAIIAAAIGSYVGAYLGKKAWKLGSDSNYLAQVIEQRACA
jgi:hypothetical protein